MVFHFTSNCSLLTKNITLAKTVIAPFALKPSDLFLSNRLLNGFSFLSILLVVCRCVYIVFVL